MCDQHRFDCWYWVMKLEIKKSLSVQQENERYPLSACSVTNDSVSNLMLSKTTAVYWKQPFCTENFQKGL